MSTATTATASTIGPDAYVEILADYLQDHGEEALYRVSLLSQTLIESGLGPEDIIALHFESLEKVTQSLSHREQLRASSDAQQFLLEVMIAYGVRFKEYLELKLQEGLRDAETRASQERERALDAERVGRQKGDTLAVIAHELRTPLTAAQGNLDYARRLLSQGSIDRLPRLLENAREAIDRLSRLSADLVEASRDAELPLQLAEHDLDRIIQQACAWAELTAEAGGVQLVHESVGACLPLRCDADGLLSVFGNLLSNAIRYTPSGGRVMLRHRLEVDWVLAEVQDTGIGMSAETQARIFEKFYRAPKAREVESKGLGLGLALVQQIVEAHGGRVEVESADGHGSTFRVRLPVVKDDPEEGRHG
jgi:signal transduction histidine kinase